MLNKELGKFGFLNCDNGECLSVIYAHRELSGKINDLSLTTSVADESRSLIATKSLRCLTGIFTVLSELKPPNSMVIVVVYRLLMNLSSAVPAMTRSRLDS